MEELHEAIEDAQYLRATSTLDCLRPTVEWEIPSEKELSEWKQTKTKNISNGEENLGEPFSPEWFTAQPIGFFLFAQFIKAVHDDYTRINFIEEVIRFRTMMPRHRREKAKKIVKYYLSPRTEATQERKKEIKEYDLSRTYNLVSIKEVKLLMQANMACSSSKIMIEIDGPLIKEAKKLSNPVIKTEEGETQHAIPECDIFNELEAIVFEALKKKYWEEFLSSEDFNRCMNFLWFQDRRVVEDDFYKIRTLGRGGFGLVTGCTKKNSGKLYAMKIMNKKRIKIKKSEQLTLNECMVLAAVNSPFVVNLKYSFQSKDDVFLILDLMTGGDLNFHLAQKDFFPKDECIYYAARIMLGLQALHDAQFVYRDLKPENCLLDEDGRMKLTDLGLACKITPTLHGAAGTRGYWAPEMLRRDENGKRMTYGHTVDWFSFGCLLAEFISGTNPYRSDEAIKFGFENGKKTKEKAIDYAILNMEPYLDPSKFDADATDLCLKLLEKDETVRIGVNGCKDIMSHAWFKDANWEMIMSDKMKPPFLPPKDVNAMSQSDIGYFKEDSEFEATALDDNDEKIYQNWNWTNPLAYSAEVIEFLIFERESGARLRPVKPVTCCCTIS